MENERNKRIREKAAELSKNKLNFWKESLEKSDKFPIKFHQINPTYEVLSNGVERIMLAGATSTGKTLPISLTLSSLNEKMMRRGRPELKALWISPEQAIRTALVEDVNEYTKDFGMKPLKIASISDSAQAKKEANIISLNYHKVGYLPLNDNRFMKEILDIASEVDAVILDECQNLKNPSAQRMDNFEEFVNKTLDKYFILASASPAHNRIKDLGVIFHILDPENYPLVEYDYNSNPFAIHDLMNRGKYFMFTREDLRAIYPSMPPIPKEEIINIQMKDEYAEQFFGVWTDRLIKSGEKLMELRKISLKSKLDAFYMDGRKAVLEDLLDQHKKEQIVMATYLKDEIMEEIVQKAERVFGKGKVGFVHGDIPFSERCEIAKKFREGKIKVMPVTMKTMSEGIPLSTYEKQACMISVEPALNPGDFHQLGGRIYRINQIGEVKMITLISDSELLKHLQTGYVREIEREGIKAKRSWSAGAIDLSIHSLTKAKEEIYGKIINNQKEKLTEVEERIMNSSIEGSSINIDAEAVDCLVTLLPPIDNKKKSKLFNVLNSLNKLHGLGKEEFENAVNGKGDFAREYKEIEEHLGLIYSSSSQYAKLVAETVKELEEKHGNFERIVDLGCGPIANIARALKKPIINLDASQTMLEKTKKICEEYKLDCKYVKAFMQKTPFESESIDAAIASSSLNFHKNTKEQRNTEDIIIETNRILKPEGYFIVTFPYGRSVSEKNFKDLTKITEDYGFKSIVSDVLRGVDGAGKVIKSFKGAYLLVAKKTSDNNKEYINNGGELFIPQHYVLLGSKRLVSLSGYKNFNTTEGPKIQETPIHYETKKGKRLKDLLK